MMAIETTYFSGTSSEANNLEVTTWLTANATEYFDKIIEKNILLCYYIIYISITIRKDRFRSIKCRYLLKINFISSRFRRQR